MKFGGTSVADVERIRNVARHVKREVEAGHDVAVVVSAMAETTTATSWPASTSRFTWRATFRRCWTSATDVPPNFITRRDKRASALVGDARLAR